MYNDHNEQNNDDINNNDTEHSTNSFSSIFNVNSNNAENDSDDNNDYTTINNSYNNVIDNYNESNGVNTYSNNTTNASQSNDDHNWRARFQLTEEDKKRKKIFTIAMYGFYATCFILIVVGGIYWWNNKEIFYLTANEVSMIVNDKYQINMYGKTEQKSSDSYIYTSENPEIVKVDENGNIKSISEGETYVTVKSKYSSKKQKLLVTVNGDSIYSVEVENNNVTLDLGEKRTIKPIVNGDVGFKADFIWKSEDSRVASVSSLGEIRGVTPGTTYINVSVRGTKISTRFKVNVTGQTVFTDTATSNNNSSNSIIQNLPIVNVSDEANDTGYDIEDSTYIGIVSVDIKAPKTELKIGEKATFGYSVSPNNATNNKVIWDSSDKSVATVDQNGNISALRSGTTDISVKTQDGNKTSFVTILVVGGSSSKNSLSMDKKSTTIKLWKSEVLHTTVQSNSNQKIVWSSSNPKVATVDQNGKVNGLSIGTAIITAQSADGKLKDTCVVYVSNSKILVTNIKLNKTSLNLGKGSSTRLIATLEPKDATEQSVTWSSSNSNVVTVDQKGNIKAIATGKAIITATSSNGLKAQCTVNVPVVKITKLTLNKSSVQIIKGKSFSIKTSITPTNAANKNLSYTSSNDKIASVDKNGVITAKNLGTVTIKVKSQDGSGKVASMKVVVVPNGGLINVTKQKYQPYRTNIANYIGVTFSKHMQNFAIQNVGKSNEIIYLSGVTTGCITANKISAAQKKDLNRTIVIKIPTSQLKVNTNKRTIMWLKNSGHGQSFDIESNGTMWINAKGKEPTYSGGKWWGGHTGIMRINFTANSRDVNFRPFRSFSIKDSSGSAYSDLDVSVDDENDLLALRSGRNVFVYRLSDAKNGKLSLLYSFKVADSSGTYRQGNDISNGYYYLLTGSPGGKMAITAYNMLGEKQYTKGFYIKNASQAKKNNEEAEGLKIYGNRIYIGFTHKYGKGSLFDIGYFK